MKDEFELKRVGIIIGKYKVFISVFMLFFLIILAIQLFQKQPKYKAKVIYSTDGFFLDEKKTLRDRKFFLKIMKKKFPSIVFDTSFYNKLSFSTESLDQELAKKNIIRVITDLNNIREKKLNGYQERISFINENKSFLKKGIFKLKKVISKDKELNYSLSKNENKNILFFERISIEKTYLGIVRLQEKLSEFNHELANLEYNKRLISDKKQVFSNDIIIEKLKVDKKKIFVFITIGLIVSIFLSLLIDSFKNRKLKGKE